MIVWEDYFGYIFFGGLLLIFIYNTYKDKIKQKLGKKQEPVVTSVFNNYGNLEEQKVDIENQMKHTDNMGKELAVKIKELDSIYQSQLTELNNKHSITKGAYQQQMESMKNRYMLLKDKLDGINNMITLERELNRVENGRN